MYGKVHVTNHRQEAHDQNEDLRRVPRVPLRGSREWVRSRREEHQKTVMRGARAVLLLVWSAL